MEATLQSILGNGVTLPHDLLPDDTTVIYDKNGKPVNEKDYNDPDDEMGDDWRRFDRYVALALAHYNAKHNTDYKAVKFEGPRLPATAVGCPCAVAKFFEAEFRAKKGKGYDIEEEVFTSCRMLKAPKTTTPCKLCDISACEDSMNRTNSEEEKYSQYLADGVSLSDKAKLRVEFPLLALAYYNKKHCADYKLVDALPYCMSLKSRVAIAVAHCNFIARDDASKKLFFAELELRDDDGWAVIACQVVRGN